MNKHIQRGLVAAGVLVAAGAANAATDVSAITGAQATLTDYGTALLALGIAVWAVMKVVRMFGGK